MSIFKKTIQHKNSFHLDEKIKLLNEDLKKTNVSLSGAEILVPEVNQTEEDEYYDWRKDFYSEQKNITEVRVEEEISNVRNRKNESLKRVDNYIHSVNSDYNSLRKEIFEDISHEFLLNIPVVEKKIDRVLSIYHELHEGLLNEPPNTNNSDPLTPLNQKFVTVDELNKHYNLFINRIQEQVATIGGGGETKLKYLDDVVGIATNPSDYDGKFLKYDHSLKRFIFDTVVIEEVQALHNVLGYGNTSTRGFSVGVSTFAGVVVNGDGSFSGIVTATDFNSASDVSLKDDISQIQNPIDKILKIDGVNFTWKESGKKSMGVIAQEVEKVVPEIVSGDSVKSVNYNGIIGLLIECVKEQQKEIQELKERLDK